MLSSASLRPVFLASSLKQSAMYHPAGVGSVSSFTKPAGSKRMTTIVDAATSKFSSASTSSTSTTRRASVITSAAAPKKTLTPAKKNAKSNSVPAVDYGRDWFAATRDPSRGLTPRQQMEMRREANRAANNGIERKDLYTDAWAGSEYRGSSNNILTWLIVASVAAPVIGLLFAWQTYGTLWG